MKILLSLALCLAWVSPLSAQSISKLTDFKRGAVERFALTGMNFGLSDQYVVAAIC